MKQTGHFMTGRDARLLVEEVEEMTGTIVDRLPEVVPPRDWTGRVIMDNAMAGLIALKAAREGRADSEALGPEDLTEADMREGMLNILQVFGQDKGLAGTWGQNLIGQSKGSIADVLISRMNEVHPKARHRRCAGCGAQAVVLGDRKFLPMTQGEGVINQGPGGIAGVPMCRTCLIVTMSTPATMPLFANKWLLIDGDRQLMVRLQRQLHRRAAGTQAARLQLQARQRIDPKAKDKDAGRFMRGLLEALMEAVKTGGHQRYTDSELMVLTPFGGSPKVFSLPIRHELMTFLRHMGGARYAGGWSLITATGKKNPDEAIAHLIRGQDDPRRGVRLAATLILRRAQEWHPGDEQKLEQARKVCELYQREVMGMTEEKIKAIRQLGERIIEVLQEDAREYGKIFGPNIHKVRENLVTINARRVREGRTPLIDSTELWIALTEPDESLRPISFQDAFNLMSVDVHSRMHTLGLGKRDASDASKFAKKLVEGNGPDDTEEETA